jgi:ribokinase
VNIIVVGSANQDYITELPHFPVGGETLVAEVIEKRAGGQGVNQSVAAARAGAPVSFVGCVGDDHDGLLIRQQLISEGVDTSEVQITGFLPTGLALVSSYPDGARSITVIPGANLALTASQVARAVKRLALGDAVVLVQAEISEDAIAAAITSAHAAGARAILNLAPYRALPAEVLRHCHPIVMNEMEGAALLKVRIDSVDEALQAVAAAAQLANSAVISLGAGGAVWAANGRAGHVPAQSVPVLDASGVGDAFVGVLAAALAVQPALDKAVETAVAAGAFVVTRLGVQPSYPTRSDLLRATATLTEHKVAVKD